MNNDPPPNALQAGEKGETSMVLKVTVALVNSCGYLQNYDKLYMGGGGLPMVFIRLSLCASLGMRVVV